jgi:hypothetical protein
MSDKTSPEKEFNKDLEQGDQVYNNNETAINAFVNSLGIDKKNQSQNTTTSSAPLVLQEPFKFKGPSIPDETPSVKARR